MRTINADALAQIIAARATVIHLIELDFSGGTLYLATTPGYDISWNSVTWSGIGGVLSLGPINESPDDRGQAAGLKLSGVDQTILALLLAQKIRGRNCRIYRAWLSPADNMLLWSRSMSGHGVWGLGGGGGGGAPTATPASTDVVDPDGGFGSTKVAFAGVPPGNSSVISQATSVAGASKIWTAQCMLRTLTGTAVLFLAPYQVGIGGTGAHITVTDSWKSFSGTALFNATVANVGWQLYSNTGDNGGAPVTVYAYDAQLFGGPGPQERVGTTSVAAVGGAMIGTPVLIFNGFLNDAFRIVEGHDEKGGKGVEITTRAASRTAELAQHRGILCNTKSHGRYFPGDAFFKNVPTLIGYKVIWPGPGYSP